MKIKSILIAIKIRILIENNMRAWIKMIVNIKEYLEDRKNKVQTWKKEFKCLKFNLKVS